MYSRVPPPFPRPSLPSSDERRLTPRFVLNARMNQYVHDDAYDALALDVSESGLAVKRVTGPQLPSTRLVGIELELPGTREVIWASAEMRFQHSGANWAASGLHFLAMARSHERLLRDYLRERRERWQRLFGPRPRPPAVPSQARLA